MKEKLSDYEIKKLKIWQKLSSKNEFTEAHVMMKRLVKNNPNSGIFHALLANTFDDLGNVEMAEQEFRLATKLSPDNEIFSLGLFHSLWDQGTKNKKLEAIEEKIRYTNRHPYAVSYIELWEGFGVSL